MLSVLAQGDLAWEMFFLLKGAVQIVVGAGTPQEEVCATMEAGSYFGELALLMGGHRSTSARVMEHCNLFVLYKVCVRLDVYCPLVFLVYRRLGVFAKRF
jgi:CRP-like cAMP-binding protein